MPHNYLRNWIFLSPILQSDPGCFNECCKHQFYKSLPENIKDHFHNYFINLVKSWYQVIETENYRLVFLMSIDVKMPNKTEHSNIKIIVLHEQLGLIQRYKTTSI